MDQVESIFLSLGSGGGNTAALMSGIDRTSAC